jgi:hypothetical protein
VRRRSPAPQPSNGGTMKKILLLLVLVALGAAVAKKVRDAGSAA